MRKIINEYIETIDKNILISSDSYLFVDSKNKIFIVRSGDNTYKYPFTSLMGFEITNDYRPILTGPMSSTVGGSIMTREVNSARAKMWHFNLSINDLNCENIRIDMLAKAGDDRLTELTNTLRFILNNK